jgi:hypothetical protein
VTPRTMFFYHALACIYAFSKFPPRASCALVCTAHTPNTSKSAYCCNSSLSLDISSVFVIILTHLDPSRAVYVIYAWKGRLLTLVISKSAIFSSSFTFFMRYSKVTSVSSFTLPSSRAKIVLSSLRLRASWFLNSRPLCSFTLS